MKPTQRIQEIYALYISNRHSHTTNDIDHLKAWCGAIETFLDEQDEKSKLCPVCEGKGQVPTGFYLGTRTSSYSPETCRRCNGIGTI